MLRIAPVLIASAAVLAVTAGPASAAVVSGAITDPAAKKGNPAQDVRGASIAYDQAGNIRGAVAVGAPGSVDNVSGYRFLLGTASVKRGICAGSADVTVDTDREEGLFAGAYLGSSLVRYVSLVQSGQLLQVDTSISDVGEPLDPSPSLAGHNFNCGLAYTFGPKILKGDELVVDDETPVFPLTAAPGPPPSCSIASRTKRKRLRAKCVNVAGPVTVRLYRHGKLFSSRKAKVGAGGAVSASARGLRRKRVYGVAVWQGKLMMGVDSTRIR